MVPRCIYSHTTWNFSNMYRLLKVVSTSRWTSIMLLFHQTLKTFLHTLAGLCKDVFIFYETEPILLVGPKTDFWSSILVSASSWESVPKTHRYQPLTTPSTVLVIINIIRVSEEKDLGVTIDDKLSFDQHINEKMKTANKFLETIRRNFSYIGIDNFSQLYKAVIRPHLLFANQIWAPHLKKHTEHWKMFSVGRRIC